MYAVVTTGGKQYRVEAGSMLVVEKLAGEPGSSVTFDRVLLVGDGESVTVGTPTVAGATVSATVLGNERGRKIVVFKFKQKVKYRRRTGHRQDLTRVRIDAITADGKTVRAEEPRATGKPARTTAEKPKAQTASRRGTRSTATAASAESAGSATATETAKPARRPRTKGAAKPEAEASKADASKAAKAEASAPDSKPKTPAKPRTARTRKPASAKEK